MEIDITTIIVAVIGATAGVLGFLSSVVSTLISWRRDKRASDVQAHANRLTEFDSFCKHLQARIGELNDIVREYEEEKRSTRKLVDDLSAVILSKESQMNKMEMEMGMLRQLLSEKDERVEEMKRENSALKDEVHALQSRVRELEKRNGH